jgi:two-component system, OmpR family, response regulator
VAASTSTASSSSVRPRPIRSTPAPELARVLSAESGAAGAPPIAVAAVVVQTSLADAAGLADLATRLAEDVRGLLQADLPNVPVSTAVAVASPDSASPAAAPAPAPRSADVIVVDRDRRVATVTGQLLDLTYREFELLAFLVEHPGRVFSRAQLLRTVWDQAEVGSRTVDVHVRRLRVKLGDEASRLTTVRNVGYRLEPGDSQVAQALETVA